MAESSTVARPYAKAVFLHAVEKDELSKWSGLLARAAAIVSHKDMGNIVATPSISSEQKAAILVDLCGDGLPKEAKNLFEVVAEHKRLAALPAISEAYEALKTDKERSLDVEITSAFSLSSEQQEKLAVKLKKIWQKEIHTQVKIDKSLIGGVIIRAGDVVIDGSVRGKLSRLAESVNS